MRELADRIPELGHGGREVGDLLIALASEVTAGAIVDIGPYLGSTTAYLALGARRGVRIYAFDTWDADICNLRAKALQFHDMEIPDDLLPLYLANMAQFAAQITAHRCNIDNPTWEHGAIGLLVDDIGVEPERMAAKMRVFGTHLLPGSKLLMLDFFWYEYKAGEQFTGARDYMRQHKNRFSFLQRAGKVGALFEVLT